MTKISDSFRAAFDRAPFNERGEIRSEIMAALGITTMVARRNRMNGVIEHTRREAMEIENVFDKHGIRDIWG